MSIMGPYIHHIDPIIGTILGVHLWWYGLSYTLGFLNVLLFIRRRRTKLDLPMRSVYNLSILLAIGVLFGGRFIEVVFYEWPFYREHLHLIPASGSAAWRPTGSCWRSHRNLGIRPYFHGKSFLMVI